MFVGTSGWTYADWRGRSVELNVTTYRLPKRFVDNFFTAVAPLDPKIANVLVQLPPYLERDDAVLTQLLAALPPHHRYLVEFRHPSWYAEAVYRVLRAHGTSRCVHDLAGSDPQLERGRRRDVPVLQQR